jgi:succinate dehydrogenase hydrophobic anchor subunit
MIERGRKKSSWRMAVAGVLLALLACGFLIFLAVRKVAVEKKVEQKFPNEKVMARPAPTFPPIQDH